MSLAVRYRPETFEDGFMGQEITAKILKNAIEQKKFKNIMLFAGNSGCGKTTAARIVAKLINNNIGNPIEIDAASNNGVDQVRAIVDQANQRDLAGEYKIFIIDEAHMITTAGWNAFLKCIEDCPKYTIFIFCTTEPQKIPETVLNRMQRYNFGPIASKDIQARLLKICALEGYTNYESACDFLSKISGGSLREAIANLEKAASFSTDLTMSNVKQVLGAYTYETFFKLTWAIQNKQETEILMLLENLYLAGQDLKNFVNLYIKFILDLVKFILFKDISITDIPAYLASSENAVTQFTVQAPDSLDYFNRLAAYLLDIKFSLKNDSDYKTTISVMLLKFIRA